MFVDNCKKKKENRKLVVHKTEFSFLIGPFSDGKNQSNYQIKG